MVKNLMVNKNVEFSTKKVLMTSVESNLIAKQLKEAASKLADSSNIDIDAALKLAMEHLKIDEPEKKKIKHTRKQKEVAECDRCMARVWGKSGEGPQCSKRRQGDGEYCTMHGKQAAITEIPLQWDENGKKKGLHLGRYDNPKPWRTDSGEVCYLEFASEEEVKTLKDSGEIKWHPNVKSGKVSKKKTTEKKEKKKRRRRKVRRNQKKRQSVVRMHSCSI